MLMKLVSRLSVALIVAEVLLVLLSWLLSATLTEGVRSLLSDDGTRWFVGQFVYLLLTPQLAWLLLLAMAGGCLWRSGLCRPSVASYQRKYALRISVMVLLVIISGVVLLLIAPQGVLLSATGRLWPSPFSRALIPLLSAILVIISACYGLLIRSFTALSDVFQSMVWGLQQAAPLILLYVFVIQFYESCCYVFV